MKGDAAYQRLFNLIPFQPVIGFQARKEQRTAAVQSIANNWKAGVAQVRAGGAACGVTSGSLSGG